MIKTVLDLVHNAALQAWKALHLPVSASNSVTLTDLFAGSFGVSVAG